jgi:hypothetical protein
LSLQFYSYRSLLLFKLVKEFPLSERRGLLAARLLMTSLTIVGLHHPDARAEDNWMRILSVEKDRLPEIELHYRHAEHAERRRKSQERQAARCLRRLGCFPLRRIDPGTASSIHYAGTLPRIEAAGRPVGTGEVGRLVGFTRVHVGDSSSWRFLPAKGLAFSLMAHAKWIAHRIVDELHR